MRCGVRRGRAGQEHRHVVTFTIVNVNFANRVDRPALRRRRRSMFDGADTTTMVLLKGVGADEARHGDAGRGPVAPRGRVGLHPGQHDYVEPLDEPDAAYETYKDQHLMRDVADRLLRAARQAPRGLRNEIEILLPVSGRPSSRPASRARTWASPSPAPPTTSPVGLRLRVRLDAVGPWPPISESHVEMDGAFALYEAWVRLQHGDIDTALVYGFGKCSPGDVGRVIALQLEPYLLGPLWPDAVTSRPCRRARCSTPARPPRRISPGSSRAAARQR